MNLKELSRVTVPPLPDPGGKDQKSINQKIIEIVKSLFVRDGDKEKRIRAIEDNAGIAINPSNIDHALLDNLNSTDINHLSNAQVSGLHAKLHPITSTADHSSSATPGNLLKADANGLPVDATNTDAQVSNAVTKTHDQSHSIVSTSDHTSSATPGNILKADANGLPIDATNTDAQVSATVTASHARSHSIVSASDHTSSATPGYLLKADANGLPTEAGACKVGGASDYSEFEADGTYKANGAATTFDDLLGDVTRIQVSGVGIIADNTENALKFQTSANLSDYAVANYQLRHRWKPGSNGFPHIHFEQTENDVPNFLIRIRWQRNFGAKTTAWTDYKCNTAAVPYVSGTLNQIAYGAALTPPAGYSLSDIIQFRVFRDNANTSTVFAGADPFSTDVLVTGIDIHIEEDTLGSRTEYSK